MKILFTFLALCFALNANAATYFLLSQTNTFAKGITNEAKAYADSIVPVGANPSATIANTANNGAAATFMRSDASPALPANLQHYNGTDTNALLAAMGGVAKAGDTMTGTLGFSGTSTLLNLPSLTTAQKNAATAVPGSQVYDSDLARVQAYDGAAWHSRMRLDGDVSTTGAAFTLGSVVLTNNPTTTVPLQINATNGTTTNIFEANSGGTNYWKVTKDGDLIPGVVGRNIGTSTSSGSPANIYAITDISTGSACRGLYGIFGTQVRLNANVFLESDSAAVLQIGSDAATATAQTIKAHDGSGTDKDGAKLTLEGGQSTGTGVPGSFDIATSLSGETSASTANAYSLRYHAKGKFVPLTHATTNAIIKFSLPANKLCGGSITALCYATNSTPHLQALTSEIQFAAVAVGTTITGTISQVDNPLAADSGTLTCAYTLVDNGDNTFYISANPNSSLSSPTERCKLVVTAMNGNAATTLTDY